LLLACSLLKRSGWSIHLTWLTAVGLYIGIQANKRHCLLNMRFNYTDAAVSTENYVYKIKPLSIPHKATSLCSTYLHYSISNIHTQSFDLVQIPKYVMVFTYNIIPDEQFHCEGPATSIGRREVKHGFFRDVQLRREKNLKSDHKQSRYDREDISFYIFGG